MNRILITGGSGFIGSNLVEYFANLEYEVRNLDIVEPENGNHLKYWERTDIRDINSLRTTIKNFKPDIILHMAARTDLHGQNLNDYNSNTDGTRNLIDAASEVASLKKVIFTSSMLVCSIGYYPKNSVDFNPSTVYGQSKVEMERIILNSTHHYHWAIVRPTSIWGPGFKEPYKNFFDMIMKRKYVHIGNKSYSKTYGYIGNVIYQLDSILKALEHQKQGEVYYLGDYEPTNIKAWAIEISEELGTRIITVPYLFIRLLAIFGDALNILGFNFPMTSFRLKNMTTNYTLDLSNTKNVAPNLPFSRKDGIRKTIEWMKK